MRTTTTPSPSRNENKRKKANLFINENPEDLEIILQQSRDHSKKPLRIDARTVVLVNPEQCTPEYAATLREKFAKASLQFT